MPFEMLERLEQQRTKLCRGTRGRDSLWKQAEASAGLRRLSPRLQWLEEGAVQGWISSAVDGEEAASYLKVFGKKKEKEKHLF